MLVTKHAVRSYRTFSPLPVLRNVAIGGLLSVALSPNLQSKVGGRYPPPCPAVSGLSSRLLRNPRPSVHAHIVRHVYTVDMAQKKTRLVAWIAPKQAKLLKQVAKAASLKLEAVGTSNQSDLPALGETLKVETCPDIRSLATTHDDAILWIAQPQAYDVSLCKLLRHRKMQTVTTTPLSGSIDQLVEESDKPPAAKFVPLMRRSTSYGEASDDIEQFGLAISAHCTMTCSEVEGTLWSLLFDAMDCINHLFGTPEVVQAFLHSTKIPDEPSDLRGHMTVNLQFAQQRIATLLLSDQSSWKREMQMIGVDHTVTFSDGDATVAQRIADGIHSSEPTMADAPRVLALCESARLSCLTGSAEQPNRVLEMF